MYGVSQNIDPPPPSPPGECVHPRLWCGGRTHSQGGEGVGGQQFRRRQTLLCTLHLQVLCGLGRQHVIEQIYPFTNVEQVLQVLIHITILTAPYQNLISSADVLHAWASIKLSNIKQILNRTVYNVLIFTVAMFSFISFYKPHDNLKGAQV